MRKKILNVSKLTHVVSLVIGGLLFTACGEDSAVKNQLKDSSEITELSEEEEKDLFKKADLYFASISSIEEENIDPEKIDLGKMLFFDKRLSQNENISCNSCHNMKTYGVDNLPTSPGDTDEHGARNSPTVIYASLHGMQFWDGRALDVEEQAGGPILNPVEHNIPSEEFLEEKLRGIDEYQELFAKVYPDSTQPITFATITNAIGAFERQLNPMSRFDEWLDGDKDALTMEEKIGMKDFINSGCITCHNGIALGGGMMQKFGLNADYWEHTMSEIIDEGAYEVSQKETDKFMFKVPGLRNIEKTYPYFHDGSVEKLEDAVRIMGALQVANELDDEKVESITTFLKSLTADVEEEYKSMD